MAQEGLDTLQKKTETPKYWYKSDYKAFPVPSPFHRKHYTLSSKHQYEISVQWPIFIVCTTY